MKRLCLDAENLDIPDEVMEHPLICNLGEAANDLVTWSNVSVRHLNVSMSTAPNDFYGLETQQHVSSLESYSYNLHNHLTDEEICSIRFFFLLLY